MNTIPTEEEKKLIQRVRELTGCGVLSAWKALKEKDWNVEEAVARVHKYMEGCI